jgi:hypothetical protein
MFDAFICFRNLLSLFLKKNKTPVKFLLIWQDFIFFAITNDTVLRIIGNGEIHLYFYAFSK